MPTRRDALNHLLAEMAAAMFEPALLDAPYVVLAHSIPVDEYDDPADPGIDFVLGPFPTAVEAMAQAERYEAGLNQGCVPDKPMFRAIAVPMVTPQWDAGGGSR